VISLFEKLQGSELSLPLSCIWIGDAHFCDSFFAHKYLEIMLPWW